MFAEFKEFINKGNAIDLAVGVIIGAAFGKIVDSLVADIIMPILGLVTGGIDFTQRFLVLAGAGGANLEEARKNGAVLAYGNFVNTVLQFFVIAFAIFLVVRQINRLRGSSAPVKP